MVRVYKRKTNRGEGSSWSKDDLRNAMDDVRSGRLTQKQAAETYSIPKSTLQLKLNGWRGRAVTETVSGGGGRKLALPIATEKRLVKYLNVLNKWGFGLSKNEVLDVIQEFVRCNKLTTPFKDNRPGGDWFRSFSKRHKLSLKKPERLESSRSRQAADPFILNDFFDKLEELVKENKLEDKPHCIYNCDETSFNSDPGSTKVVAKRGENVHRVTAGSGRETTTVLACIRADGSKLPPMILHKGKRLWDSMFGGDKSYPDTSYFVSEKGWMTEEVFYSWFTNCFIPNVTEFPALLIYDGHLSHIGLKLIEKAVEMNVTILKLPPHTSHLLQPLDVSVFRGVKSKWDEILTEWCRHHYGQRLTKSDFADILGETWRFIGDTQIKSGFKKCGIYDPDYEHRVNRNVIKADHYDPEKLQRYLSKDVPEKLTTDVASSTQDLASLTSQEMPNSENAPSTSGNVLVETTTPVKKLSNQETPSKSFERILLKTVRQTGTQKKAKRRIDHAEVITKEEFLLKLKEKKSSQVGLTKRKPAKSTKKKCQAPLSSESDSEELAHALSGDSPSEFTDEEAELQQVEIEKLKQGTFVLVEFTGGHRNCTKYRYVCIVQRPPDLENEEVCSELSVMSLQCQDKIIKKTFITKDDDISFVNISQVLGILDAPTLTVTGERIKYVFNEPVKQVFEK